MCPTCSCDHFGPLPYDTTRLRTALNVRPTVPHVRLRQIRSWQIFRCVQVERGAVQVSAANRNHGFPNHRAWLRCFTPKAKMEKETCLLVVCTGPCCALTCFTNYFHLFFNTANQILLLLKHLATHGAVVRRVSGRSGSSSSGSRTSSLGMMSFHFASSRSAASGESVSIATRRNPDLLRSLKVTSRNPGRHRVVTARVTGRSVTIHVQDSSGIS